MRCLYVYNKVDTTTLEVRCFVRARCFSSDVPVIGQVCDMLARLVDSVVISCRLNVNFDVLLAKVRALGGPRARWGLWQRALASAHPRVRARKMWEMLELVRVYTKKKGQQPDFSEPVVLTRARGGYTVQAAIEQVAPRGTRLAPLAYVTVVPPRSCVQVSRALLDEFNYVFVWGRSTKHNSQVRAVGARGSRRR